MDRTDYQKVLRHLRQFLRKESVTEEQVDHLELELSQWWTNHWRDDDSPQSETTFGIMVN